MSITTRAAASMALALFALGAGSQLAPALAEEGDAFRGGAYSGAMCAACHAVAEDASVSMDPAATPFNDIEIVWADAAAFTQWINTKHPLIPGKVLTEAQCADILAYIRSIAPQPG
ncbi:MAG: hypothetical protein R3C52_09330 [Hyphomonadaceae bacterium]